MSEAVQTLGTCTMDNLIADTLHPIDVKAISIATGSATYESGTLINTSGEIANGTVSGGTAGVYTLTISTALVSGDSLSVGGKTYEYNSSATTATNQASEIAALFEDDTVFTVAASSATVVFTQKVKGTGAIPTLVTTGLTTGAAAIVQTTEGVAGTLTPHTPVGILCEEVTQSPTETTPAMVYISGSFVADEIIVGDDVTISSFETELRKLGIFVK